MRLTVSVCVVALVASTTAALALDAADKCEAKKNKIAGKYYRCRENAEAKAILKGLDPDYSKCTTKFDSKWNKEETNGEGMCPDNVLTTPMNTYITGQAAVTAAIIAGTQSVPTCGDNVVNVAGEQCDGTDLGGETCVSLGLNGGTLACSGCLYDVSGCQCQALPATGQTTCWNNGGAIVPCPGTGTDGDVRAGAALAYVDNGDGTITDLNTGLMWEKLGNEIGNVHAVGYYVDWEGTFATRIAMLNSDSFAGHTDWRMPNIKELLSIVHYERAPTVHPVFDTACVAGCSALTCSCTGNITYWSSTTDFVYPSQAYYVYFLNGSVEPVGKGNGMQTRAVRGGS